MGDATPADKAPAGEAPAGEAPAGEAPAGEVPNAADATNALADSFWNGLLDLSPITATMLGYEQGMDRLDDPGPEGRDRARTLLRETLAEAEVIAAQAAETMGLPVEERITLDILRVVCEI